MRWIAIACVLNVAVMAGCRSADEHDQRFVLAESPGRTMVRTELFFGMGPGRPGGAPVTDDQWNDFVRREVTPRFPEGLTIVETRGQWRDESAPDGVQREPSRVLVIVHPGTPADHQRVEDIRGIYCRRFEQQAVMRADSIEKISF